MYKVANVLNSAAVRLEYLVKWLRHEGTNEQMSWKPKNHLSGPQD